MKIDIRKVDPSRKKPIPADASTIGFGHFFSDHMFMMEYSPQQGWHDARIEPYHSITLDPAAIVFHYSQEVFEGLKAYRGKDDGIYLFRYKDNFRRMNHSCTRMVMPEIDIEFISRAVKELVLLERDWIPKSPGCSLYIRPTMIGIDAVLGVHPSQHYLFYIIVGPAGAYYPEGFNPVSIYVSDEYVRAARGGVGEAKTGGNYAAQLLGQVEAQKKGFTQVLWLDAVERRYIEEVGTMNIFFKFGDEVVTSPLNGSVLHGVTRDSIIHILKHWGMKIRERQFTIDEVVAAQKSGALHEVFGSGTAAIISPVKSIHYRGVNYPVADGNIGPVSQKLYDTLLALQYGYEPDPFGWVERIDK
jgi:branched-chain amino acid aminotransferase